MPAPDSPFRSRLLPPALIAIVVALAFLPSTANGFTNWDDYLNFRDNPSYRGLGWAQLKWMWSTPFSGHYHPLTWMTLGLDYALWGMAPLGYHLTNVLLHAANSVLLYFVIAAILRQRAPAWPAVAGALLHALHPLRVESVAWVTERRDVLCGFFALLTVLAYLKRVEEDRAGRPSGKWLALACAAFAASLLSKALSIMLPIVLLILDAYPLQRLKPATWQRVLLEKIPFFALSCADAVAMTWAMRQIDAVRAITTYNLPERVAQAVYGLCFYIVKSLWPLGLIPLYRVDVPLNPWQAKYLLPLVAVIATTAALVYYRRRWPAGLVAWASYVVLLIPVLGVAVTGGQVAADRYTYLAMIPMAVLAAAGLERFFVGEHPQRRIALSAACGVLALLSVLTIRQIPVWKDSITLWTHQLRFDPDSSLAYNSRGAARQDLGDAAGAIEDCTKAIELDRNSADPYLNRGLARAQLGDFDGALRDFDALVQLAPKRADGYVNRGVTRIQRGDLAGAYADFTEALKQDEGNPRAYVGRGRLRARRGDLKGAADDFERALRSAPEDWAQRRETQMLLDRARQQLRGS